MAFLLLHNYTDFIHKVRYNITNIEYNIQVRLDRYGNMEVIRMNMS